MNAVGQAGFPREAATPKIGRMLRPAMLLLAVMLPAPQAGAFQSSAVTVYRCVDGRGHVSLGDAPCPAGSKEQVRTLQRPVDAPVAAPSPFPPPPPEPVASPPPQIVVMRTPQPMYECTTPDGQRYTSETGDGNPRWVPLWTLGYRARGRWHRTDATAGTAPVGTDPATRPHPPRHPRPAPHGYVQGGGTWIRDTCHALPQAEVCARLRDRREQIRRRFFNAQETERDVLRREERGINARLGADCG